MGRLTAPENTPQGIEVYALCRKTETSAADAPGRREVRDQLASDQFDQKGSAYLKELRSQAMIEYR